MLTTPKILSKDVNCLRDKIDVATAPVFVPIRETLGHTINECFQNVRRKIARDGGSIQYGWMVWELPGKLIEGEFQAVWIAPDGRSVDITPKPDGEEQILFIPDPERVYQNAPVKNFRLALTADPDIRRTIPFHEEKDELSLTYNDGSGRPKIPLHEIVALEARYFGSLQTENDPMSKVVRNVPCPCGSGRKFKHCHGAI